MAAFREACRLGADGIEFDVQQTADGALVVIHDFTVDRTTNGHGPVFESTWSHLRQLDAGSWFSPLFAGERIPLLEDVLALDNVQFELELKDYGEPFVDEVLQVVTAAGVIDLVEFTSWNLPLLSILKTRAPNARIGLFSHPRQSWMTDAVFEHVIVGMAATSGADVAHVYASCVTPSIVDSLHGLGLQVHANDATSPEQMKSAVKAGVDRLSANDVASAVAVRHLT